MKWLLLLILAACEVKLTAKSEPETTKPIEKHESDASYMVGNIKNNMIYFRDDNTKLCFALSAVYANGHAAVMANVPCTFVPDSLLK